MYTAAELAIKYGRYLILASNGRGHGIHSPFVYAFTREVLMDNRHYPAYGIAEKYREKVKRDHRILNVDDLGAGSSSGGRPVKRSVSKIARVSVKPRRYSRLLYRIAHYYQYRNILELGTSLGVTTTYLAQVPSLEKLVTMEGADEVAAYAESHFLEMGLHNTELVRGNFDDTLSGVLNSVDRIDLAFIDGNHRKKPTLDYFHRIMEKTDDYSCLVFDDIHWSPGMEEAWEDIKKDNRVRLSIDLFFLGIVFFSKSFVEKQDFMIRF
jgi:predicted O-methyltransferase YrrM